MTLYAGQDYPVGRVLLRRPVPRRIRAERWAHDVADSITEWLSRAEVQDDICYFSVIVEGDLVGQIFLHDIDLSARRALVGYHLFRPEWRGHGIGTHALKLLQRFVVTETTLMQLVLITSAS